MRGDRAGTGLGDVAAAGQRQHATAHAREREQQARALVRLVLGAGALAIVDASGHVHTALGDVDRPIFPRSAVKLLQALPLVASGAAEARWIRTPPPMIPPARMLPKVEPARRDWTRT